MENRRPAMNTTMMVCCVPFIDETATLRDFTYNSRSELLENRISRGGSFCYQYDNIGNRKTAQELEEEATYKSNSLNQYTDIAGGEEHFKPIYDADGSGN